MPGERRRERGEFWRGAQRMGAAILALTVSLLTSARAEEVRIGTGYGLAFLPAYLCEDLQIVEKHGKDVHLDLKARYHSFGGATELNAALLARAIDIAPFGVAPLLIAWEKASGTPLQILAVSGLTTLPLTLLSNRAGVHTLKDFRSADRIAVPTVSSPQTYLLRMQAEKVFGQYDRMQSQIEVLPNPDAIAALATYGGSVGGYFSSPPFTQIALGDGRIHKVLSSSDVIEGKASFLVLGATRGYVEAHAKAAEAVAMAVEEAAGIIRDDPRRAAQIYLAHEPWKTLDTGAVEATVMEIKDEFGSAVRGVQAFADFMGRHGELKAPPQTWKDIVAPALLSSPSS
jgi:NitT/TauT family transport system substrate-binding protein